jgi:hypothetical protein
MIDARYRSVTVHIAFGEPIARSDVTGVMRTLATCMRELLDSSAEWKPLSSRDLDPATTAA